MTHSSPWQDNSLLVQTAKGIKEPCFQGLEQCWFQIALLPYSLQHLWKAQLSNGEWSKGGFCLRRQISLDFLVQKGPSISECHSPPDGTDQGRAMLTPWHRNIGRSHLKHSPAHPGTGVNNQGTKGKLEPCRSKLQAQELDGKDLGHKE